MHMREKAVEACRRPVQRSSRVECARQILSRGTEGMLGNSLQISDFRFGTGNGQISSPRADFRFQISDFRRADLAVESKTGQQISLFRFQSGPQQI